ncbi:MAG: hypothetical protein M9885_05475, partial [Burkholderiaceae bacterium]|nr:hypothetical protein [Burkholderiaceae bacterium]
SEFSGHQGRSAAMTGYAAFACSTFHPGKTNIPGWHFTARARTFARFFARRKSFIDALRYPCAVIATTRT